MSKTPEKQKVAIKLSDSQGITITNSRSHNMEFLDAQNIDGLHIEGIQATHDEPQTIDPPKRFWDNLAVKAAGPIIGGLLVMYLGYRFGWN